MITPIYTNYHQRIFLPLPSLMRRHWKLSRVLDIINSVADPYITCINPGRLVGFIYGFPHYQFVLLEDSPES